MDDNDFISNHMKTAYVWEGDPDLITRTETFARFGYNVEVVSIEKYMKLHDRTNMMLSVLDYIDTYLV